MVDWYDGGSVDGTTEEASEELDATDGAMPDAMPPPPAPQLQQLPRDDVDAA
jgi:hypothetical protein